MPKVSKISRDGTVYGYVFYCPGCKFSHSFHTEKKNEDGAIWEFNGNVDNPTFSPSLLARYPWGKEQKQMVCHSFVRNGKIEFLGDCTHKLAGQTVEMQDEEI